MLAAVLGFGLFWSAVAPELVTPGMTIEQAEAILGPAIVGTVNGGTANPSIYRIYGGFRPTGVSYDHDLKVRTVFRHR